MPGLLCVLYLRVCELPGRACTERSWQASAESGDQVLAVRLRLKRTGRRHRASFRLAAVDGRRPRDGRVIEELGVFDPSTRKQEQEVVLKRERIEYWLGVGAQPSDTVRRILEKHGIGGVQVPARRKPKVAES